MFDESEWEPVSCASCFYEWSMAEEWSQLQYPCPYIQITLKITYVYLIVFKTVNSVQKRVKNQDIENEQNEKSTHTHQNKRKLKKSRHQKMKK